MGATSLLESYSVARRAAGDDVTFTGFEMHKSVRFNTTHDGTIALPVFENSQDMNALEVLVQEALSAGKSDTRRS
ncbi:MAG: hypothetical protein AAFQ82_11470 [Myxococcota bacterium]